MVVIKKKLSIEPCLYLDHYLLKNRYEDVINGKLNYLKAPRVPRGHVTSII
jgi:hypothetical protein